MLLVLIFSGSVIIIWRKRHTPFVQYADGPLFIAFAMVLPILAMSLLALGPTESAGICAFGWICGLFLLTMAHSMALLRAVKSAPREKDHWVTKLNIYVTKLTPKLVMYKHTSEVLFVIFCLAPQAIISILMVTLRPPTIDYYQSPASAIYIPTCSWNEGDEKNAYLSIVMLLTPFTYMITNGYFLFRSLSSFREYEIFLARPAFAGWFTFTICYAVLLPFYFLMPNVDSNQCNWGDSGNSDRARTCRLRTFHIPYPFFTLVIPQVPESPQISPSSSW